MRAGVRCRVSGVRKRVLGTGGWGLGLLLVTCSAFGGSLVTDAFAATHVTATYDLGSNPRVMTTVGGQPQYGLVFAQRNKTVTYNSVEYNPSVVKGYLNASGQLNNGAGSLWLDLIPNLGATIADGYYVVTFNIQGRVHAEIWIVPDIASVAADAVRQAQPPSSTSSGFDLSIATGLLALAHGGTGQSGWTAGRCVRVNNAGIALESAAADCGTGGGSAPLASATVSGTVKTDTTAADPVVYLKASADTLLAAKAPTSRNVNTTSPLSGGGDLSADRTLSCPTCEVTGNKNVASGYAGLTAGTKLAAAQGQEVWSVTDLTDYASTSGTGTAAIRSTITSPATNDVLAWSGSNWINQAPSGGSNHNFLSSTHSDTTAASTVRGDMIAAVGATPTWQRVAHSSTTGGYWKWNGTDVVASTGAASGSGACGANTWASTLNGDAAPTCTQPASSNLSDASNVALYNNGSKTWGANSDFTWSFDDSGASSPTLAFAAGSATLSAAGSNQNLTLTPSGTGYAKVNNRLGVGDSIGPSNVLIEGLKAITNPTADQLGMVGTIRGAETSAANSHFLAGALFTAQITASNTQNWTSTFGQTGVIGQFVMDTGATGTVSHAQAFLSNSDISAGTVTNLYGLRVPNATGTGTLNNQYGVYIEPLTKGATSNYAIYTAGTQPARFGGAVNAIAGFQVNGAGTSGRYLKGDGTNFVVSSGSASGVGSCTNQAVTGLNSDAAPTCTTITSAYTSGTFSPSAHNLLSSTHGDTTAGTVARGDLITGQGASATWQRLAKGTASQCLQMDGAATDVIWGSCAGGGGGDNISVNGTAATDADFDDATPAAESGYQNVKWQKDASSPTNISAEIPFATSSLAGTVSTTTQSFAGAKTFNSDLAISTDGSSESTPRVGAFSNLTAGEATRFQFGDAANAFQLSFGSRMQVYSYWGMEIHGSRQTAAGSPPTFLAGASSDANLSVINEQDVVNFYVKAKASQTADLQRWVNSSDATLAKVDASGNLTSPVVNATTGFRVNGAATTDKCLLGNGTNFVQSASDCLTTDNTKTLTNKTFDTEATGNVLGTVSYIFLDAGGCQNTTAFSNFDLPTSGAAVAACNTGANTQQGLLDFATDSGTLTAQRKFQLPADWNSSGAIEAMAKWKTSATANDVVWQVAIACVADAQTDDPSFTDTAFSADTAKGTANQQNDTAWTTITTTGGCAAGEMAYLRLKRDPAHASDTLAAGTTARLIALSLRFRRTQ